MKTVRVDRSRVEAFQRCNRLRWLEYHQSGTGIVSAKKPLPLAVGGSVHEGLAHLLRLGQQAWDSAGGWDMIPAEFLQQVEDGAANIALADFALHRGTLALDTTELAGQQAGITTPDDALRQDLAASVGLSVDDAGLAGLMRQAGQGAAQFDEYLWAEQSALVEAMVRAYSRRRLRPLLEQYEVLEVEREGEWELARWHDYEDEDFGHAFGDTYIKPDDENEAYYYKCGRCGYELMEDSTPDEHCPEGPTLRVLKFMSRPDALLRDRTDNSLYILSFKTAASWDIRKARDAQHDMQGLSEGVEVERRLGEWWGLAHSTSPVDLPKGENKSMWEWLHALPAPPRILGIRYEYMLKSYRGKDRDLSAKVGFEAWTQRSHLIRQYVAHSVPKSKGESAYHHGDVCWSWEWLKPDGTESKLAWQNWSSRPVWDQPGGVKGWIDALDSSAMQMSQYDSTVGMEPREMGWAGLAQALGTTKDHPLDSVFIPPIIQYRNEDESRDWLEQIESQECEVAEHVAEVDAATDDGERRSLLNRHFRQSRRACSYPTECAYVSYCWGGEDLRRDPIGSGRYAHRVPNHPMELVSIKEAK